MSEQMIPKATQYNDSSLDYRDYWSHRQYEQMAEVQAISKLLAGYHFQAALDVGGGYGRLSVILEKYADEITLLEPSSKQLELAKIFLKDHPKIKRQLLEHSPRIDYPNDTFDLVMMVRVMHHLPDPTEEIAEIHRVLKPGGRALIEVANYAHFINRMKYLVRLKRLPLKPIDIRSDERKTDDFIPFVDHHPKTVTHQFCQAGFTVEKVLSVSNLRSPALKKIFSPSLLLKIEKNLQEPLSKLYFGPSLFFLLRKP